MLAVVEVLEGRMLLTHSVVYVDVNAPVRWRSGRISLQVVADAVI